MANSNQHMFASEALKSGATTGGPLRASRDRRLCPNTERLQISQSFPRRLVSNPLGLRRENERESERERERKRERDREREIGRERERERERESVSKRNAQS